MQSKEAIEPCKHSWFSFSRFYFNKSIIESFLSSAMGVNEQQDGYNLRYVRITIKS